VNIHVLNLLQYKIMNIVIPMAGKGTGFKNWNRDHRCSALPKPLIAINGKSMITHSVETCGLDGQYIFIINKDHKQFGVEDHLKNIVPDCKLVEAIEPQSGQATAVLFAEEFINNDEYLVIQNCDHRKEWSKNYDKEADGWLGTQELSGPEWSYARINNEGWVIETAEKREISKNATIGMFAWKRGKDYVKYCKQMVKRNIRVKNEFYVNPVYNQAIADGLKFKLTPIETYWSFGSPAKVEKYLEYVAGNFEL